jgi:hypothetical protein
MPLFYPPVTFPVSVAALVEAFDAVERDAARLIEGVGDEAFNRPPEPGAWSAAECLDHLATTITAYVPAMERGLAGATPSGAPADIRPGLLSRWFIRQMEPPVKRRYTAPPKARPARAATSRDEARRRFLGAGEAFRGLAQRCERVDVNRRRFPNPFAPLRFTLGTGLVLMVVHHRRHVCQMERALRAAAPSA